ncbi:hypothetical protein V2J09_004363 [Rumex salicifolius]
MEGSKLIKGLVFKKHAAHKHMATKYTKPKLMLIQGVLGHSSGLSSFNSMIHQDKDNVPKKDSMADDVKKLNHHLEVYHPNVVLMESAPRDVMENILKKGMTLVVDMKLHRLERIARYTGSSIWSANNMQGQKLKKCDMLYFEKFIEEHAQLGEGGKKPHKTLMFLEDSRKCLGCTILLKGSNIEELKKIKCVVQCAVVMACHYILEKSFLIDQEAMFSTMDSDGGSCEQDKECSTANLRVSSTERTSLPISNGFDEEVPVKSDIIDIPISGSIHQESVKVVGGGDNLNSQSEYEAVDQDVIGTLVSSAKQYMEHFLNPDCRTNNQAANDVPDTPTNYEKSPDFDNSSQGLLSSLEVVSDFEINGSDSDEFSGKKDDISAVLDSESILISMSSRNALTGTVCEQSRFSHIKFYRNFDVPLGKFLQDNVLNQSVPCKACGEQPEAHFYYYAHNNKQLTIRVKQISGASLPGESAKKLWMWSRCGKCNYEKVGGKNTTKLVLMSRAARGFSFGKLSKCGHSLDRDFLCFFGLGSMVSMFRYSPVAKYTVAVPPQKLEFNSPIKGDWLLEETVHSQATSFFAEVSGYLKKIETRFSGLSLNINGLIKEFIDIEKMLAVEEYEYEEKIKNNCRNNGQSMLKLLCLNRLRWELFLEACIWNRRLQLLLTSGYESAYSTTIRKAVSDNESVGQYTNKKSEATLPSLDHGVSQVFSDGNKYKEDVEVQTESVPGSDELDISTTIMKDSTLLSTQDLKDPGEPVMGLLYNTLISDHSITERKIPVFEEPVKNSSNAGGRFLPGKPEMQPAFNLEISRGQWIWKSFSEIREECMKVILERAHLPSFLDSRFTPLHSPEFLPTVSHIISEEASRVHIPLCNDDYVVSEYGDEISTIIACAVAFIKDVPQVAKKVSKDPKSNEGRPTSSNESIFLPRSASVPHPLSSLSSISPEPGMIHPAPSMSSMESNFSSFDGLSALESLGNSHPVVPLGVEANLGKAKYSVVCLYANEFRGLRNLSCPSELDYIASLSRCKVWDAKGGKSKAFFAKTLDNRFIIKEIKRTEFESFTKFASEYFKYMKQSFKSGNQTCLAKILGIYQVTMRQPKSGKETKHGLVVIEHLSYGRNHLSRQYDLKGALHARYTANADGSGDVLLDQNFVNDMNLSPLYVGQNAKRLLQRAVWNDTTFLNVEFFFLLSFSHIVMLEKSINVMDYSLLVGVDLKQKELVCGIIDYLRQYTLDKQLESWVKSSLVVPKNLLPTVISPKEYKKRFRKFMDTHFLTVPDQWCSRRPSNPCKLCGIPAASTQSSS